MRAILWTALALTSTVLLASAVGHSRHPARLAATSEGHGGGGPVLLELFTSEGCSSCPPADALLRRLDEDQSVGAAPLIVLSEHVDYWNDIGWKDPYSSHLYSERQSAYAAQFGNGSVYTPQMVVDGRFEFVGSDERKASHAIREAANTAKVPVDIAIVSADDRSTVLNINISRLPAEIGIPKADVFLALADEHDESQVSRGENAGRTLQHVAVLRKLTGVGEVNNSADFSKSIALEPIVKAGAGTRVIVIVQQPNAGRVVGVGVLRVETK